MLSLYCVREECLMSCYLVISYKPLSPFGYKPSGKPVRLCKFDVRIFFRVYRYNAIGIAEIVIPIAKRFQVKPLFPAVSILQVCTAIREGVCLFLLCKGQGLSHALADGEISFSKSCGIDVFEGCSLSILDDLCILFFQGDPCCLP
jgi:hypothetical protein